MTPTVPAFPSCTACSDRVVEEYRRGGFDFVRSVCRDEDGSYLKCRDWRAFRSWRHGSWRSVWTGMTKKTTRTDR